MILDCDFYFFAAAGCFDFWLTISGCVFFNCRFQCGSHAECLGHFPHHLWIAETTKFRTLRHHLTIESRQIQGTDPFVVKSTSCVGTRTVSANNADIQIGF